MKHIKLFEGFDTNNNPTSITLEMLPGFYNRMKEFRGTVSHFNTNIRLFDHSKENSPYFNLFCVGELPYNPYNYGGVISQWISYSRDISEISIYEAIFDSDMNRRLMEEATNLLSTSTFYNGMYKRISQENQEYNRSLMPQDKLSKGRREEWNFFNPTGYCKFEDGVEPGKIDSSGYFRIKEVK
jgi:hypothetical protein